MHLIISCKQVKWLAYNKTDRKFPVLLAMAVQTCKQALFLVSEDYATPLAYLKMGDSALQPLLYKGECKEASSSLYPCLSYGGVRSKYSVVPKGGLDTRCSLVFAPVHCVLETALFGLLRVVYLC